MALSKHRGFQITVTSGMLTAVTLQFAGAGGWIVTAVSLAVNFIWLWEEDISRVIDVKRK